MNISDSFAGYLTQAVDPGLSEFYDFMRTGDPIGFQNEMDRFSRQLDETLERYNMTDILDLYRAIAVGYVL